MLMGMTKGNQVNPNYGRAYGGGVKGWKKEDFYSNIMCGTSAGDKYIRLLQMQAIHNTQLIYFQIRKCNECGGGFRVVHEKSLDEENEKWRRRKTLIYYFLYELFSNAEKFTLQNQLYLVHVIDHTLMRSIWRLANYHWCFSYGKWEKLYLKVKIKKLISLYSNDLNGFVQINMICKYLICLTRTQAQLFPPKRNANEENLNGNWKSDHSFMCVRKPSITMCVLIGKIIFPD